jgi:SAM-dependent methyltransferase
MVPMQFAPYARIVAERFAGSGGCFLETAAGTGILARELAAVGERRIVATDLSPAMLDVAKAEVRVANVEWLPADAGELPFENAAFDTVVCQFGTMFFPDKRKAFGEAHRVLRAGGRFVAVLWDRLEENEIPLAVTEALAVVFPDDPPAFMRNVPHGYYDRARIESDLRSGGFRDISFETLTLRSTAGSAAEAAVALCAGTPMRNDLAARTSGDLASTIDAVTSALRRRFGTGPIEAKMQALLVEARR